MQEERSVSTEAARGLYNRLIKRLLDLGLAALALILLSPLMLAAALADTAVGPPVTASANKINVTILRI